MEEVPLDIRRRGARILESVHGTEMAPGGKGARLGDEACPVYRPDIQEVAYWELEVVGIPETTLVNTKGDPGRSDRGFIVLSTAQHDVPLPHFSLELAPPSRALEAMAGQGKIARVVKLDSLCYAAEDQGGNLLGHLGNFPPKLSGLPNDLKSAGGTSSASAAPTTPTNGDSRPAKYRLVRKGPKPPDMKMTGWDSWDETKKYYGAVYRLHLEALAKRAAESWELESFAMKFGEGIHQGDSLSVRLLKKGKSSVRGDGAAAVTLSHDDRREPPAVLLEIGEPNTKAEVEFELVIDYEDGTQEVLLFFIVPKGAPSNQRSGTSTLGPQIGGVR